jgi:hypothetical protein
VRTSHARARAASVALVVIFSVVALVNVVTYPPGLGFDAIAHRQYMEGLTERGEFPVGEGAYYHPPGFYAVAGAAVWLGEQVGLGEPLRVLQLLNAVLAVATALLVLELGRTIWPGRPIVHVAALGLFTAGALVLKAAAMFHPETLSLFLSTLALLLAARMIVERNFALVRAVMLGLVLGAGQLVRAFSLWTFAVVVLALVVVAVARPEVRRRMLPAGAVVLAATALVAGPWYVHQAVRYGDPVFSRPEQPVPLWERRPLSFYVDPGLPEVVTDPHRPNFANRFAPQLYADAWGDWYGVFVWNASHGPPEAGERRELVAQSVVGALPTLLALGGWLALLGAVLSRPRVQPERLLVALLPLAGIAGMLYFTVSYPTPDGDVIKPTYALTTAPAWALCFGVGVEWVAARGRAAPLVLALVLAVAALASLRIAVYPTLLGGLI